MKLHHKSKEIINALGDIIIKTKNPKISYVLGNTIEHIKKIDPVGRQYRKEETVIPNLIRWWERRGNLLDESV